MSAAAFITLQTLSIEPARADTVVARAHITLGRDAHDISATATGTIAAMTEILYALGAGIEIVRLSQQRDGDETVTYLLCERDSRQGWSSGRGRDGDEATVNALIAGANQLAA
ncbi:hypothetical protein [Gordonia sp. (in: high G+C Gram-positive bacteria)]|uniref:hypothetical protein n=1 Tax=Gordonia sp. (in: high G+C Gram-positive bacteria) TaxID=84139 RepID=UPI003C786CED